MKVFYCLVLVGVWLPISIVLRAQCQGPATVPQNSTSKWEKDARVLVWIDPSITPHDRQVIQSTIETFALFANSGVTFTFVPSQLSAGAPNTWNIHSGTPGSETHWGETTFNNVRHAETILNDQLLAHGNDSNVRRTAAHEAGHTFGLADCDHCPPGASVMDGPPGPSSWTNSNWGSESATACDQQQAAQNNLYPQPQPPDEDGPDGPEELGVCGSFDCPSPILVSTRGNRLELTDADGGVNFDLNADGFAERLAWTSPTSDDAFLVLDRNRNGRIDDGTELFGNFTPQPPSDQPNGFIALSVFDDNGDGWISAIDPIFAELQFWIDQNHDGFSQSSELRAVADTSVLGFNLNYRESRRRDRYGNEFRYISTVAIDRERAHRKFAVDVFFVTR